MEEKIIRAPLEMYKEGGEPCRKNCRWRIKKDGEVFCAHFFREVLTTDRCHSYERKKLLDFFISPF